VCDCGRSSLIRCSQAKDALGLRGCRNPPIIVGIRGYLRGVPNKGRHAYRNDWRKNEYMSRAKKTFARVAVCMLLIGALSAFNTKTIPSVHATPSSGSAFDHIAIIAMENTPYSAVFGDGTPSGCQVATAPFLCSMLSYGTTFTHYSGYGNNGRCVAGCSGTYGTSDCSAACYVALTSGNSYGINDNNECGNGSNTCNSPYAFSNIIGSTTTAQLTSQAYCEYDSSACPRHSNHFPFEAYSNTNPNNCFANGTCQNIFGGTSTSCSGHTCTTADFINIANSANVPNLLWWTPSDNHNMHDDSITSGDSYLRSFLIGTGTSFTNPSSGSLLASKLFAVGQRTLLVLWWDECSGNHGSCDSSNDTPILFYDPQGVRPGYVSTTSNAYDEYSLLRAIEDNWNLPTLTSNDAAATGMLSVIFPATIQSPAKFVGWGGVGLDEVTQSNVTNIASNVGININGHATNTEEVIYTMQQKDMNIIRVDFDPSCTHGDGPNYGSFSESQFSQTITIAKYYNFWVILDYHGYTDVFNSGTASCWLSAWNAVVSNSTFGNPYPQIIWEPENEPCWYGTSCPGGNTDGNTNNLCTSDSACISTLSSEYNSWISQARSDGDTHWIVTQNLCSYGCGFLPTGDGNGIGALHGYPTVTDSSNHIFISLHSYYDYNTYSSSWTNATAGLVALNYTRVVLGAVATLGHPALNTEGGADPICSGCAPGTILTGSAGYTKVTFYFIQTLTNLYQNSTTPIGFTWFPAGSWTGTPGDQFGALQCSSSPKGWGCLLSTATFSINAVPNSISFPKGGTGSATINIAGKSLVYPLNVALTVSAIDITGNNAMTCTLNPSSVTMTSQAPSTSSTLFCPESNGDLYVATVTGVGSSTTHSTTVTFYVYDFTISANPSSITISTSNPGYVNITGSTNQQWPEGQLIYFPPPNNVPSGMSISFASQVLYLNPGQNYSNKMTISVDNTVTPGTYSITVIGENGSLNHQTTVTVIVT